MKEDKEDIDLTKRIDELESSLSIALDINDRYQRESVALKKEMEELRAQLARSKEDHQYDKLVYQKEAESLKNPINNLRKKGLM
jgi:predicted RNase H-like nuclease (RuvC/YqgF family)